MGCIYFPIEKVREKGIVLALPKEARHPTQNRTKLVIRAL